ncbi:MAG: PAS domain-containing protein [Bacteroidota bacterium]
MPENLLTDVHYATFFELSSDVLCILDVDGTFQTVNKAFSKRLGFTESDLVSETLLDYTYSEDQDKTKEWLVQFRTGNGQRSLTHRFRTKEGEYVLLEWAFVQSDDGFLYGRALDIGLREVDQESSYRALHFEGIAQLSPSIIYIYNLKEGRNEYTNRSIFEEIGYSQKELQALGTKVLSTIIHPEDYAKVEEHLATTLPNLADGETVVIQYRAVHKMLKTFVWLESLEGIYERDEDGNVLRIIGIVNNITQQKADEIRLKTNQDFIRQSESVVKICSWVLHPDTLQAEITSGFYEVHGFKFQEVPEASIMAKAFERVHPEDQQFLMRNFMDIKTKPLPFTIEYRYVFPSGEIRWLRDTFGKMLPDGRLLGITQDISDSKNHEINLRRIKEDLEHQKELLSLGERESQMGTWIFNHQTQQSQYSEGMYTIYDVDRLQVNEQEMTKQIYKMVIQEDLPLVKGFIKAITERTIVEDFSMEFRVRTASNKIKWLRTITGTYVDEHRLLGITQDITREKLSSQSLTNTHAEFEQFVYSISHDLRAPVRHIEGFAKQVIKSDGGKLSNHGDELMGFILRSSHRLGNMIDELLAYSKNWNAQPHITQFSMAELVQRAINAFQPSLADRKVNWKVDKLPLICADQKMIRLVLENLISNAIKYTSKEAIANIAIQYQRTSIEHQITVEDNGAGFNMAYYDKLFKVFQRLHTQSEYPGHGIGLANVKRMIHLHHGRIWGTGKERQGASFTFTIPLSLELEVDV